ncbi:diguanylate cyclase domain-containing protein [Yoonia sp.]|uniref:GGDEF domain-containing protein n=1 Tax=Yoonia sp. TaxID=2212373 RepID=UPI003F6BDF51
MEPNAINRDVDIGIVVAIASVLIVFSLVLLLLDQYQNRAQTNHKGARELVLMHLFLLMATATLAFGATLEFWLVATLVIAGALGGILSGYLAGMAVLGASCRWPAWALFGAGATLTQCAAALAWQSPAVLFVSSSAINGVLGLCLAWRLWQTATSLDTNSKFLLTLPFLAMALAYLTRLAMVIGGASPTALVLAGATIAYVLALLACLSVFAMISIRAHRVNQSLDWAARHDPLTGLENRRALAEFSAQWANYQRLLRHRKIICACMDLDHFKQINDTHGHAAGDQVLQEISVRLRNMPAGAHGRIFRIGGDEFVLWQEICPDTVARTHLQHLLQRLCMPVQWGEVALFPRVSIGYSESHVALPVDLLIKRADAALYQAKAEGRGRVAGDAVLGQPQSCDQPLRLVTVGRQ